MESPIEEQVARLKEARLPRHVAVIMDGNGRWAKARGLDRIEGHKAGTKAVRAAIEACLRLGIPELSLFSFSTENWTRPPEEVNALMGLFCLYVESELENLIKEGIRLRAVGDFSRLSSDVVSALTLAEEKTKHCSKLTLVLALSYSGREEILNAVRRISQDVKLDHLSAEEIDENVFRSYLWSAFLADPDLLIRTSGEMRISNFFLWQIAYTELVVMKEYWPDFNVQSFLEAVGIYQERHRRFGGIDRVLI